VEDLEEKLAEVQAVVNLITAKLYSGGAGHDHEHSHDEGADDEL